MSLDAWKFLGVDASSSIKNRSQEGAGQGKKNTMSRFFPHSQFMHAAGICIMACLRALAAFTLPS
jgi:hypothetical protein